MMRHALIVALALTRVAHADGRVPERARALAHDGQVAFAAGDYTRAIAAFQAAYAIAPSSALLFDLAQAYRLADDCADAALMYHRFLATDGFGPAASVARAHLATVERCAATAVRIALPVSTADVELALPAVAPPEAPRPVAAPAHHHHRAIEVGLGVAAAGALGIAVLYAVDAHAAAREVSDGYARGATWHDLAVADARGKYDDRATALWGIAGVLAIGGAIGIEVYDRHTNRERAQVTLAPTRDGARVGVSWSF